MTKPYIVCFSGGPLDGTAQEQEYLGVTAVRYVATDKCFGTAPLKVTERFHKHTYIYDQIFALPDGRHVAVANHNGIK